MFGLCDCDMVLIAAAVCVPIWFAACLSLFDADAIQHRSSRVRQVCFCRNVPSTDPSPSITDCVLHYDVVWMVRRSVLLKAGMVVLTIAHTLIPRILLMSTSVLHGGLASVTLAYKYTLVVEGWTCRKQPDRNVWQLRPRAQNSAQAEYIGGRASPRSSHPLMQTLFLPTT